jgi:hypothetical protein
MFAGIGLLFFLAIGLLALAIWVWTLLDIIKNERLNSTDKLIWILVVFFFPFLGSLIYLAIGRKR